MDRALLRPGRFGKLLYVPLPSPDQRVLILKALARNKAIDATVDLSAMATMAGCENLSGADLAALVCLCSFIDVVSLIPISFLYILYVCMYACVGQTM